MSDEPENKDGLKRDRAKLRKEYKEKWRPHMRTQWQEWKDAKGIVQKVHKTTNLCVEACRASAYFTGHAIMLFLCANTLAWTLNALAWVGVWVYFMAKGIV